MAPVGQLTFVPGALAASGDLVAWSVDGHDGASLEREIAGLGLPPGDAAEFVGVAVVDGALRPTSTTARRLPLLAAVRVLAAMPPSGGWPSWRRPADSVLAWSHAAKLATELVAAGRLVPALHAADDPRHGVAVWRVAAAADDRLEALAEAMPAYAFASFGHDGELTSARACLVAFLDAVADACVRQGRRPQVPARRRGVPTGMSFADGWAQALRRDDPRVAVGGHPDVHELATRVDDWSAPVVGRRAKGDARLALRLNPPAVDASTAGSGWTLALGLVATAAPPALVAARAIWEEAPQAVDDERPRIADPQGVLVRELAHAARVFAPLDRALSQERPEEIELAAEEVAMLLDDGADALASAGVRVELPPELRGDDVPRLRLRLRIGRTVDGEPAPRAPEGLDLQSLTRMRYELVVGDEEIERDDAEALLAQRRPLVRWRGRWVRIDDVSGDALERDGAPVAVELTEALAAALTGRLVDGGEWIDVRPVGDLAASIERLRAAGRPEDARIRRFDGTLRDYQRRGVAWLQGLLAAGMGGVLADEMGLGKTVQAIAVLAERETSRPHLVVCPTSVVGNWERELQRFAPDVAVRRHHGADRSLRPSSIRPGEVVVTSYALLRRDASLLVRIEWDLVVLDEAQQVKNARSKAAQAARSLPATARIAMTGTPIENRLGELWAILDLTNPGILGSRAAFDERFGLPVERWGDAEAAGRLKRLVAPFVLRRRKDDPEVSVALPPKHHVEVRCALTREQAAIYRRVVDDAFAGEGMGRTTFERRGRILALLTALKQICNHPRQYTGDDGAIAARSGKVERVTEILGEVVDAGETALIFTQFRVMGSLLVEHLQASLDLDEVPFLHGGVGLAARDAMVERFQSPSGPPLLVVSLRAGGSGLNLTRARHVVHVDRWWNPAVEDQATDRAHRIGQARAVTVHTLVTVGTLEERIGALLARKRALAAAVVGEGESWIGDLDDRALRDLVELTADREDDLDDLADEDEPAVAPGRPSLVAIDGGRA